MTWAKIGGLAIFYAIKSERHAFLGDYRLKSANKFTTDYNLGSGTQAVFALLTHNG
jgi:hypothetical protein